MSGWEYAVVDVVRYQDGSGGEPRELLHVTLPGQRRQSVAHAFGAAGYLNTLGAEGWELVDVESGTFYLKRQIDTAAR